MSVELSEKIINALNNSDSVKVLATNDKNGIPHITFKGSLHYNKEQGYIEHYEILESSQTNSNLVFSIWFNRQAAVSVLTPDRKSYQIKGHPVRCITSGTYFENVYNHLQSEGKDIDLAAIWWIEPEEVKEETFAVRVFEDEEAYPLLKHVDRLLKK